MPKVSPPVRVSPACLSGDHRWLHRWCSGAVYVWCWRCMYGAGVVYRRRCVLLAVCVTGGVYVTGGVCLRCVSPVVCVLYMS
jgi:hypothetical protein